MHIVWSYNRSWKNVEKNETEFPDGVPYFVLVQLLQVSVVDKDAGLGNSYDHSSKVPKKCGKNKKPKKKTLEATCTLKVLPEADELR